MSFTIIDHQHETPGGLPGADHHPLKLRRPGREASTGSPGKPGCEGDPLRLLPNAHRPGLHSHLQGRVVGDPWHFRADLDPYLWIMDLIRIRGSVPLTNGSRSGFKEPYLWLMDPYLWLMDPYLWLMDPFLWLMDLYPLTNGSRSGSNSESESFLH